MALGSSLAGCISDNPLYIPDSPSNSATDDASMDVPYLGACMYGCISLGQTRMDASSPADLAGADIPSPIGHPADMTTNPDLLMIDLRVSVCATRPITCGPCIAAECRCTEEMGWYCGH